MRILLQFPEGLKQKALEHAKRLEKGGDEVFISASPTFGACDLAIDEAKNIKADKLIHFGHGEFHNVDFNVEYVPYEMTASLDILERDAAAPGRVQEDRPRDHHTARPPARRREEVLRGQWQGGGDREALRVRQGAGPDTGMRHRQRGHHRQGGRCLRLLRRRRYSTRWARCWPRQSPSWWQSRSPGRVELMDRYRESTRKQSRGKILGSLGGEEVRHNGEHQERPAQHGARQAAEGEDREERA